MSKTHHVPFCTKFNFNGSGDRWRVVDSRTGEIVKECKSHEEAFAEVLRHEYPAGSKFPG